MKKLFLTLITIISLSLYTAPAFAKCEGGVEFTGVVNNHTYCRSKGHMSWWAAFAWCEFQGRKLVTLDEACVGFEGATGDTQCPNIKIPGTSGADAIWTANRRASDTAYTVLLANGTISSGYCNGDATIARAMCY